MTAAWTVRAGLRPFFFSRCPPPTLLFLVPRPSPPPPYPAFHLPQVSGVTRVGPARIVPSGLRVADASSNGGVRRTWIEVDPDAVASSDDPAAIVEAALAAHAAAVRVLRHGVAGRDPEARWEVGKRPARAPPGSGGVGGRHATPHDRPRRLEIDPTSLFLAPQPLAEDRSPPLRVPGEAGVCPDGPLLVVPVVFATGARDAVVLRTWGDDPATAVESLVYRNFRSTDPRAVDVDWSGLRAALEGALGGNEASAFLKQARRSSPGNPWDGVKGCLADDGPGGERFWRMAAISSDGRGGWG